jgi:oligopeptidase A
MNKIDNPLIEELQKKEGLPRFDLIKAEHFIPALKFAFAEMQKQIEDIENNMTPTWEGLCQPIEDLELYLEYGWNLLLHFNTVKTNALYREAEETMLPEFNKTHLLLTQNKKIYKGLKELKNSKEYNNLNDAKKRIIDIKIKKCEQAGVGLEGEKKTRFNQIYNRIAQLGVKFRNNLLDSTKSFELIITDKNKTQGWPHSLKNLSAMSYIRAHGNKADKIDSENGPWRITLDQPSYMPFLQHHRDRNDRYTVYKAFASRASEGKFDNLPIIIEITKLRKEMAQLLGYKDFAAYSLDVKMAKNIDNVKKMYKELEEATRPFGKKDLEAVQKIANENGQTEPIKQWDVAFWAERLREKTFNITDDSIRPYFPFSNVKNALFDLGERLFGIKITEIEKGKVPVWDENVQFYDVANENGKIIAHFYLDPFVRPGEKRSGAWMENCFSRRIYKGKLRNPVIYICCNATTPVAETPSLFSFREVRTLFHEFGHALQGMLTTVDEADAAGCNGVEWDAVELCSQFMENWCTEQKTMAKMTHHYKTGEPMPKELLNKVLGLKKFRAAYQMQRQMSFGKFDLCLNSDYDINGDLDPAELFVKITNETCAMPAYKGDKFLCGFQHIFANEYAAGYYSYKWAEVLSADCYAAFEEAGLNNEEAVRKTGRRFRDTFLALGGSKSPSEVFRLFRGRDPETKALLRHSGCLEQGEC